VATADVERGDEIADARSPGFTNAFTTFAGPPVRRRSRYGPTEAGTTIVSA
jgi:hypothetical protein